jgi:dipeptidyl aminopeptidase/acylaminoacyl peptidase
MRTKVVATVVLAIVLVAFAVLWAVNRREPPAPVDSALTLTSPGLLVRDTVTGHLALVTADGKRRQSKAECARAYASGGRVLCLQPNPTAPGTFQLALLNASFDVERTVPVNGVPTRTRVSADGRMLGFTVFVAGDSYTSSGFSTRSGILDLGTEVLTASLEDFTVDGHKPPTDANFWGVSFAADDNTFYVTMSTGPHFYLVQGDHAAETLTILADGVECPSVSPDGGRLVYKKRLPDRTWRLWVYDLATRQRTQLAEPANVDDQGAWLDDHTIGYGKLDERTGAVSVWSVPADGSGAPIRLAENAESPSMVR